MPPVINTVSLSELKPGEKARVVYIDIDTNARKLSDIGIIEGTEIEALYKSPFGNPAAYLIRGTVFALRNETAEKIIMERTEKKE